MLSIIAVPVMMEMEFVLSLWLEVVPEYTAAFIKITILASFVQYSNLMVLKGIVAIGKVKQISTLTTPMYFIILPLVYIVLKIGWEPTAVYIVSVIPSFLSFLMNLWILSKYTNFHSRTFFFQVFIKSILLICIASIIPFILRLMMDDSWQRFIVVCSTSVISTIIIIYLLGLNPDTKSMVKNKLREFQKKIRISK